MTNLGWKEAITQVLKNSAEPMHYTEIAEAIVEQELRANVGATPARTVSSTITMSIRNERENSPFLRVAKGYYALRSFQTVSQVVPAESEEEPESTGLINAFGMYWTRDNVLWAPNPAFLASNNWAARRWIFTIRKVFTYSTMVGRWSTWDGRQSSLWV